MSSVTHEMMTLLKQVEAFGKKKYGNVDWERFRRDGRDDNTSSIIRHVAEATVLGNTDHESGLHPGTHAAFRLLMQVIEDQRKTKTKLDSLDKILKDHQLWLQTDGAQGSRANLRGANLQEANLEGANLYYADLRGADLQYAYLRGADLERANLRGANLQYAYLHGADLYKADLRGADLKGANLRGADLEGARLDHIHFRFSYNNKHELNAYNDEIRIGCKVMSSKEWLNSYEQIGKANGYSEDDIRAYGKAIKEYIKEVSDDSTSV